MIARATTGEKGRPEITGEDGEARECLLDDEDENLREGYGPHVLVYSTIALDVARPRRK